MTIPEANFVTALMHFEAGSRDERPGEHGCAHFLEHLFFRGTPAAPDPRERDIDLVLRGGDSNAATSHETTKFSVRMLPEEAGSVLPLLRDQLENPLFSDTGLAREKGVIVGEFFRNCANPFNEFYSLHLPRWAFPGSNLDHYILGTPADIRILSLESLRRFYHDHYHSASASLALAGPPEAIEKITGTLNAEFGGFRSGTVATPLSKAEPRWSQPHSERLLEYPLPTGGISLELLFPGPAIGDSDIPLARMTSLILTGSGAARLNYRLREQDSLVYAVTSGIAPYRDFGYLQIKTDAEDNRYLGQIMRAIKEELDDLATHGPSEVEMNMARALAWTSDRVAIGNDQEIAERMLWSARLTGKVVLPQEDALTLQEITPSKISKFVGSILNRGLIVATGNVEPGMVDGKIFFG